MQQDLPAYPSSAALDCVQQHPACNREIQQQPEQVNEDEIQQPPLDGQRVENGTRGGVARL